VSPYVPLIETPRHRRYRPRPSPPFAQEIFFPPPPFVENFFHGFARWMGIVEGSLPPLTLCSFHRFPLFHCVTSLAFSARDATLPFSLFSFFELTRSQRGVLLSWLSLNLPHPGRRNWTANFPNLFLPVRGPLKVLSKTPPHSKRVTPDSTRCRLSPPAPPVTSPFANSPFRTEGYVPFFSTDLSHQPGNPTRQD